MPAPGGTRNKYGSTWRNAKPICLFLFWPRGFRNPVISPPGRVSRVTGVSMWVAIDDHLGAFGGHGRPFGVRWIGIWGNVVALDAHWVVRGGHLGSIWWPDAPGWLLTPICILLHVRYLKSGIISKGRFQSVFHLLPARRTAASSLWGQLEGGLPWRAPGCSGRIR